MYTAQEVPLLTQPPLRRFVCASYQTSSYSKPQPAPLFRHEFSLEQVAPDAQLILCGLGFYDLWVNGHKITKGLLAPYIANPDDLIYYDRYNLAPYLQPGPNAIGIMLGTGLQNPLSSVWDFELARHNGTPRVSLLFTNGPAERWGEPGLCTFDATALLCSSGEITFDNLRSGVHCDARLQQAGWTQPGFQAPAAPGWQPVLPAERPRGQARFCQAEPIRVRQEIRPVSVRRGELTARPPREDVARRYAGTNLAVEPPRLAGGYIYDFGLNSAGIIRLHINGEAGQQISLQFAERLDPEGRADPGNISHFYPDGFGQRDLYICAGHPDGETFAPPFTYHGFRYVYVEGIRPEQATPELLTYLEAGSDLPERATLATSDPIVNQLFAIARRSDRSNFYYFPTDCPHREKNGWTGDASVSSEHMIFNLGVEHSWREWLANIRAAQREDGALPGIVPTTGWGFAWGNGPAWDSVAFTLPYYTWIYRGDQTLITENAPMMLRYLNYVSRQRDQRGLVAIGLGDWCPVGRGADQYQAPLELTDSLMVFDMCQKAQAMAQATGDQPLLALCARELGQQIRQAIRRHLIDPNTLLAAGNCQTSQALPLYLGIFKPGERPAAFQRLLEIIRRDGEKMTVGFLGGRVLFHVLADFGYSDLALRMITRPDYPSYGNWLQRGATTLWEDFMPEGQQQGSENHHFWGDISHWFLRQLAGIRVNPLRRDPNEILIRPHFVQAIDEVKATYAAPAGRLSVHWKRLSKQQLSLTVRQKALAGSMAAGTLPAGQGLKLSLELPDGFTFRDSGRSWLTPADEPRDITAMVVDGRSQTRP